MKKIFLDTAYNKVYIDNIFAFNFFDKKSFIESLERRGVCVKNLHEKLKMRTIEKRLNANNPEIEFILWYDENFFWEVSKWKIAKNYWIY